MSHEEKWEMSIGETHVTVRRAGSRGRLRTARILGREATDTSETLWLDRLVVKSGTEIEGGWTAGGAVSTVVVRAVLPPECLSRRDGGAR